MQVEEKEEQLRRQVGTMMKMDTDVGRLVEAINAARNKFVADIRSTLAGIFQRARAEEVALLDTVVRENRFFQSRIGHQLLSPRVAALSNALADALSTPVQLRMETTYSFPSVPREELDELMRAASRSSGDPVPIPGDSGAPTRMTAAHATDETDPDARYVHWEPGMLRDEQPDDPANELAQLDWRPPAHRDWSAWVNPMNARTPARSMLANSGPGRVTFNSPDEVLLSQSERTRRHVDFLSLERLPALPSSDISGTVAGAWPPQRTRRPLELSAADALQLRPSSAPARRRPRPSSPPPPLEVAALQQRVIARNSLASSPQKGFALPRRHLTREDEEEQRTAAAISARQSSLRPVGPGYSIEPIRGGLRSGPTGSTEHPQFYRIAGPTEGGHPLQSPLGEVTSHISPPARRPSSALETHPTPMYRPISPTAVRMQSGHSSQVGVGLQPTMREQAAAEALAHLPPGASTAVRRNASDMMPRLSIPSLSTSDQFGELGMVEATPRSPNSPSPRSTPSASPSPREQGGRTDQERASSAGVVRPNRESLAQLRHRVVSDYALYAASGRPEVLQQQLVNAVQDAREQWAAERRRRLELETRLANLGENSTATTTAPKPMDNGGSVASTTQPTTPPTSALTIGVDGQGRGVASATAAPSTGGSQDRNGGLGNSSRPSSAMRRDDSEAISLGGWSETSGDTSFSNLPSQVHNSTEAAPLTDRLGAVIPTTINEAAVDSEDAVVRT
jgi:hypothetical protein